MAIQRTAWIDDDGTGTTGTIINNAEKTLLYNQIDAALAAYLPLAGGTLAGDLIVKDTPTYSLIGAGPNGLGIAAIHGAGAIRFYSGGVPTARGSILPNGGWVFGGATQINAAIQTVQFNGNLVAAVDLDDTANGTSAGFIYFTESGTLIGSVLRAGATNGVTYNTTSDRRLKHDGGRAVEVAGLRAVIVHDFTWKADGSPDRGIFAQETAPIFPRAITTGSDGDDVSKPWMTDYSKFVPDLIVGWQDHDRRLAHLETLLSERTAA